MDTPPATETVAEAAARLPNVARIAPHLWRLFPHSVAAKLSRGKWQRYSYLVAISQLIARAVGVGGARIIFNLPPRHGKSELCSIWTPVWFFGIWPHKDVMVASYGSDLAVSFGRQIRDIVQANTVLLPYRVREDVSAADEWHTDKGGSLLARGIAGGITGRGFDLGIPDDPHKDWAEACSPRRRQAAHDWFRATFLSRAEPKASIIVPMTRWHDDDLTSRLVNGEDGHRWTVISLPAIAAANDPFGREEGSPLCPERYDLAELESIRQGSGREAWAANWMQAPEAFLSGRAYYASGAHNIGEPEFVYGRPLHVAVDFNSRPNMHAVFGQHDEAADAVTAISEISEGELKTSRELGEAIGRRVAERKWRVHELHLFGDPSGLHAGRNTATGVADWTVLKISLAKTLPPGVRIVMRVARAAPRVADRLATFNEALYGIDNRAHYVVRRECKALLRDLKEVKCESQGVIDKSNPDLTHASDAEGYRLCVIRPIRVQRPPARAGLVTHNPFA